MDKEFLKKLGLEDEKIDQMLVQHAKAVKVMKVNKKKSTIILIPT